MKGTQSRVYVVRESYKVVEQKIYTARGPRRRGSQQINTDYKRTNKHVAFWTLSMERIKGARLRGPKGGGSFSSTSIDAKIRSVEPAL